MCQSNTQYDTKPHEADIDKCLVLKRASNAKTRVVLTKGVEIVWKRWESIQINDITDGKDVEICMN